MIGPVTMLKIKKIPQLVLVVSCFLGLAPSVTIAQEEAHQGPRAAERSYGQNFKDMAFAHCLSKAYEGDEVISSDIASSHRALIDWTYFDLEKAPEAVTKLAQEYLALDYTNPLVKAEVPNVEFNYLKCLDLYHSDELNDLMLEVVPEPERSVR